MTRNRMLMSLLVIAMAAALIGGATMAWFTDAAQTNVVEFQAGTLLINVDELGEAEAANDTEFATLDRLNPGDCWTWEFDVHNQGSKSANWLLYLCYQEETGLENLGEDAFGNREGFGTGLLSEVLEWTVEVEGDGVVHDGLKIADVPHVFDGLTAFGVPGEDGVADTKTVTVTACLPGEEAGNEYQGAKMEIAFGVKAWQTTNGAKQPEVTAEDCPFDVDENGENGENGNDPFEASGFKLGTFCGTSHDGVTKVYGPITELKDKNGSLVSGPVEVTITVTKNDSQPVTLTPITKTVNFTNGAYTITDHDNFDLVLNQLTINYTVKVTIGGHTEYFTHEH